MPPSENEFVLDAITPAAPTSTVTIPQTDTNNEPVLIDSKAEVPTNAEKSEIIDRSPTAPPSLAPSPAEESTDPPSVTSANTQQQSMDTNSVTVNTPTNTNDGILCEALCPDVEPFLWVKDSCDAQTFLENGCISPACQYSDLFCFFDCVADVDVGGGDAGVGMWSGACEESEQSNEGDPASADPCAGSRLRIQFWAASTMSL